MKNTNTITSFQGEYRWLSNFYFCRIFYKGCVFPSVEHAYQWEKCLNRKDKLYVLYARTPGLAKEFANAPSVERRPDWDEVKVSIMKELLRLKFQNEELRKQLLETKDKYLIEGNNWKDTFWGVCKGEGFNRLGLLLMEIREEIKKEL